MQVSTFLPTASSTPVSAPRVERSDARASDFDSVYEADDRAAANRSDVPEKADREPSEAGDDNRDAAPPADDSSESTESPDGGQADGSAEAPRDFTDIDTEATEEGEEATTGEQPDPAETPQEPAVAFAETPARPTSAQSAEIVKAAAPAAAVARGRAAEPDAPPTAAATDGPEQAQPQTAPLSAQPAPQQADARPIAETVIVRRVRGDEPAPEAETAEAKPRDVEVRTPRPATGVSPEPVLKAAPDAATLPQADPSLAEAGAVETRTTTAEHVARAEATVRHDTPRPVMQQVAEAARALRDGPVELTMQPEELGKVRMTLSAGADGTMTMTLQAERSETLDLLRRHIGELARELQDLGFSNLSFSFGQDRTASGQPQHDSGADGEGGDRPVAAVPLAGQSLAAQPTMAPVSGGLDLRL